MSWRTGWLVRELGDGVKHKLSRVPRWDGLLGGCFLASVIGLLVTA